MLLWKCRVPALIISGTVLANVALELYCDQQESKKVKPESVPKKKP
jgi:hypothetical protein